MTIEAIELWHKRARPEPDHRAFELQLGCHLEEVAEMLDAVEIEIGYGFDSQFTKAVREHVVQLSTLLKKDLAIVRSINRKEFLDSLADQIVTAVGVAHCAGMNITKACERVNASNWSKFDENGQPLRDANGKIAKGPKYLPPDLDGLY